MGFTGWPTISHHVVTCPVCSKTIEVEVMTWKKNQDADGCRVNENTTQDAMTWALCPNCEAEFIAPPCSQTAPLGAAPDTRLS